MWSEWSWLMIVSVYIKGSRSLCDRYGIVILTKLMRYPNVNLYNQSTPNGSQDDQACIKQVVLWPIRGCID